MSNQELQRMAGSKAADEPARGSFPDLLKRAMPEIARALPRHLSAERMSRIALTCFRDTPKLADCDPLSVLASCIRAAQLGLEPGINGRAYLVPYYNNKAKRTECQFIPGWKGLVELVNRTGRATCWTGAVYPGDEFEWGLGDRPFLKHKPGDEFDDKRLERTYAIGRVNGADWPVIECWSGTRIRKHRDRYNKVGDSHYSFTNWEMYARKIPLMQVLKYLPSSPELEAAMHLSTLADAGDSQGLTLEGVLTDPVGDPPVSDVGGNSPDPALEYKGPSEADIVGMIGKGTERELVLDLVSKFPDEAARKRLQESLDKAKPK
jgi:recombination protein RecT